MREAAAPSTQPVRQVAVTARCSLDDSSFETGLERSSRLGGPSLTSPRPRLATVVGAAIEGMRPYQWLKNVLVFTPLAAAHRITEWALLVDALGCFVAFSLTAS